jgi:YcxB-like protein
MMIEYETTVEDVVNFQRYYWSRKIAWASRFGFALALANGLLMGRLLGGPGFTARSIVLYVACGGLFLLAWALFLYGIAPLIAKKMIQRGKTLGIVGRHIVQLEAGGCRESTDVNEAFQTWRGIDTIEADARYLYIFLPGGAAHIIPRRAFPNTAASDAFFAAAKGLHAANSEAGASTSAPT